MKRLAILLAFFVTTSFGIGIQGVFGGNIGLWKYWDYGLGKGGHIGLLVNFEEKPFSNPLSLGLESGFLLQNSDYWWRDLYDNPLLEIYLDNLVIPTLAKVSFDLSKKVTLGFGAGPLVIIHTSGRWTNTGTWEPFERSYLQPDIGLQFKGDIGIKLFSVIWLKPALAFQMNSTLTDDIINAEDMLMLSLGLECKF